MKTYEMLETLTEIAEAITAKTCERRSIGGISSSWATQLSYVIDAVNSEYRLVIESEDVTEERKPEIK